MIAKADYLILKDLKNHRRLREYYEDEARVNSLIENGFIEIQYGDKLRDAIVYPLEKSVLHVTSAYQQFLALTIKGHNAMEEYQKTRNGKILRVLFEIALAVFSAMFGYFLPNIIGAFKAILFR